MDVFIVTSGRLGLLQRCCRSVAQALITDVTVTVLVNGEHPETRAWLREFAHPSFRVQEVPAEHRTAARNRPLDADDADIVFYLDDDVEVPPHLFGTVLSYFAAHPDVVIVGGPNLTPAGSGRLEALVGAVMTSMFAAPMVRVRYGARANLADRLADEKELMFCNLAVRRAAIPPDVRLRVGLKSNEENLFLYDCARRGLRQVFLRNAFVYHHRRPSLAAFARQTYSYGFGRAQQTRIRPASLHPAFLAPAVAWVAAAGLLAHPVTRPWTPWILGAYLAAAIAGALESPVVRGLGISGALSMGPLTLLLHAAYGLGFWRGLFVGPKNITMRPRRRFSRG